MTSNDSGKDFLLKKINGIYVFANIHNKPVLAGRFKLENKKGSFVYGKSYLNNPDAYPIDPINLPLIEKEFTTYANKGFFGVLLDAGPDQWGRKVYSHHYKKPIVDEMDALIAASGGGVGSLLFSLNRNEAIEQNSHKIKLSELESVSNTINKIIHEDIQENDLVSLLLDGSSLGGARPKVTIKDDDGIWIAKINKDTDIINQAKTEHVFLSISKRLGINTSTSKLIHFQNDDALLVKRFDREDNERKHFISFQSLINNTKVPAVAKPDHPYGYQHLAQLIRKLSYQPKEDLDDMFKRMLFNVMIHNTDDHAKNHGFLYNHEKGAYSLSPAFDLVPQLSSIRTQSLIIGDYGRESSIRNVLSASEYFNKSRKETMVIFKDFQQKIPKMFEEESFKSGLSDSDISILNGLKDMIKEKRKNIQKI